MSGDLYLSRLTLKRSPEIGSLINILQPKEAADALATDHRLVWSVMPAEVQQQRDSARCEGERRRTMLWRREGHGRYLVLGPRPEGSSLFEVETKPFAPALRPGDELRFVIRVNATVDRRVGGRAKVERRDIVMDLLHPVASGQRAGQRDALALQAATDWLRARAEAGGFRVGALAVEGYRVTGLADRRDRARIGILDLAGMLEVLNAEAFLARIEAGFGRAKAFGCGLMLIRRT
jgi:CRISPR system Cascade subunit CasE